MNELVKEERSWWQRNWKWVVPTGGCLTLIIVGILVLGSVIFGFVDKIQESSGGDEALILVKANEKVKDVLGEPIEKDGFGSYRVNNYNGHKTAEVTIPIKGSKAAATLFMKTSGSGDSKTFEIFELKLEATGEVIDLRETSLNPSGY